MTLVAVPFAQGLAKYVEWSANMMEEEAKKKLKAAELQCKKNRVKMWANYVPPASNSKAIHDQNFTGKVNNCLRECHGVYILPFPLISSVLSSY